MRGGGRGGGSTVSRDGRREELGVRVVKAVVHVRRRRRRIMMGVMGVRRGGRMVRKMMARIRRR